MTPTRPWERIDRWLAAHEKQLLGELRPPLEDADRAFELAAQELGALSDALTDAYRAHDGEKRELCALFGATRLPRDALWAAYMWWLPFATAMKRRTFMLDLGIGWAATWLPFAEDAGGNVILVDTRTGWVAAWDHETGQPIELSPRLDVWMAQLADDMEAGLVGTDEEDGRLIRLLAPRPPDAPAPELAGDHAARVLLTALVERELVLPRQGGDPSALLADLRSALGETSIPKTRQRVLDALDDSDAIDDVFADDETLDALLRELR
jgi:cell wall assembly regulator SMI1